MTVTDLWYTWSDLDYDTEVDLYTSGFDLLGTAIPIDDVLRQYGDKTVYTFASAEKAKRKIITIEV